MTTAVHSRTIRPLQLSYYISFNFRKSMLQLIQYQLVFCTILKSVTYPACVAHVLYANLCSGFHFLKIVHYAFWNKILCIS